MDLTKAHEYETVFDVIFLWAKTVHRYLQIKDRMLTVVDPEILQKKEET